MRISDRNASEKWTGTDGYGQVRTGTDPPPQTGRAGEEEMKKPDILKPAIFILAAACIPLLMFLPVLAPTVDWLGRILPTLSAFAYGASCLVIPIFS